MKLLHTGRDKKIRKGIRSSYIQGKGRDKKLLHKGRDKKLLQGGIHTGIRGPQFFNVLKVKS